MRAVGYRANLDVGDPASLVDVTMPVPVPGPHDLLVRVRAVSVNPIDYAANPRRVLETLIAGARNGEAAGVEEVAVVGAIHV